MVMPPIARHAPRRDQAMVGLFISLATETGIRALSKLLPTAAAAYVNLLT
jgi:hypothetical protein